MSGAKLLFILGGPGSGKSSVANIVKKNIKNGFSVNCGQIDIKLIFNNDDPLTVEQKSAMEESDFLDDDDHVTLLHKVISRIFKESNGTKFVLDGFPKTKQQIKDLLSKGKYDSALVLLLQCPREVMEKRCKMRDSKTDTVDADINDFEKHKGEIKSEFASMKVLVVDIDTTKIFDEMEKQIQDSLKKAKLV